MPNPEQTVVRVQRLVGMATIALVASTRALWTPGTDFPQIPWFGWSMPAGADWIALAALIAACLMLVIVQPQSRLRTSGSCVVCGSLLLLFLPSQQRLQPWAWEFLLIVLVTAVCPARHALKLLRWLVAGIYVHSALSKIDLAFFGTQGEMLLEGLLTALHVNADLWSDRLRWLLIGLFPVGELVIGIGLLIPTVRRWAFAGSCVMHGLLMLSLGPLGLDHRPGVLIWNAYFIGQNLILFGWRDDPESVSAPSETDGGTEEGRRRKLVATVIVMAAITCPFLENLGLFDVWPSWAVYSSRPSIVTVHVDADVAAALPASLQEFVGPREPLTEWRPVNIDAWSFATLNCPVYPQERFRIAVISSLVDGTDPAGVRVVVEGPPNRWTGEREKIELPDGDALRRYSERFMFNATRHR